MADVGLRELGAFVPGRRGIEPAVPPLVAKVPSPVAIDPVAPAVIITPPPPSKAPRAVFGSDLPTGADALGIDAPLAHLAELVGHRGSVAPLCIGLVGGPGSGKSFALHRLVERIGALAAAAATLGRGPFLSKIHVQRLDAANLEGDPARSIAADLHAGLSPLYPELAREIGHTARDPAVVMREINEKLDETRRRLDAERRTLDESGSRRARLTETVLYESAGSQVDSYARANRAGIENRLSAFGLSGDPIRTYKDLVRVVAETGATGLAVRSLYAFKGQTRLIVLAILCILAGFGIDVAIETQDRWLGAIQGLPPAFASTAAWLSAHVDLLGLARKAANILAVVFIVANLFRAFGFMKPILRGARFLKADLESRRRDLDGLYAHQTKRVDGLEADVERLTRGSAEAERRAGQSGHHAGLSEPSPFERNPRAQAQGVFAALGRLRQQADLPFPERIVLALDHLESVPPDRARLILEALHRAAVESGAVTLVAVDPSRLMTAPVDLERWIQVPLRLDARQADRDHGAIVAQALGLSATGGGPSKPDAARSALDEPVGEPEAALLAALAPLAGTSPRAIKRFVNLFSLARLGTSGGSGALALMLALDQGGTPAERDTIAATLAGGDAGASFDPRDASPRLRAGLDAVERLDGRLSRGDVAKAAARASLYSVSGFDDGVPRRG